MEEGIGIVINQAERHVYRANAYWLEIIDPGSPDHRQGSSSQLAIGVREEDDPESNSSQMVTKRVVGRHRRWCWIEDPRPLIDENGIASSVVEPINGWQFPAQQIEPEPAEPLPLPEWNRDRLPVAPGSTEVRV